VSDAVIGKDVAENLMGLRYSLSGRDKTAKLSRVNLSYAHVLVVDDIPTNLDVVRGMMKPYQMKIDCATSGPQAIEKIRSEKPRYDAVFMDHMMPEMDGVETTRNIREKIGTDYARNIPIIALTANAIVGNEEMFLQNGFQGFISKPIDMAKLDAVLKRWVRDKCKEGEEAIPIADMEHSQESDAVPLASAIISGIDRDKALERFSGDEEVLTDVLRSYARGTRPLLSSLREALAAENLADYAITVHGIKGSSYGIVAQKVGEAAEALEMAAKAGNLAEVQNGHAAFASITEALLDNIEKALGESDAESGKPVAAEPDPALLAELREACAKFDMDRVDAAMKRLEAFRYENGGELVAWLREQVGSMTFENITGGDWPAL
jgi:CheY-like chemotaxis protein